MTKLVAWSTAGFALACCMATEHAEAQFETTSLSSRIQFLVADVPDVFVNATTEDFSFFMWVRPTDSPPPIAQINHIPFTVTDTFEVTFRYSDDDIQFRLRADGTSPGISIELQLRDECGQLPEDEWVLLAVSWHSASDTLTAWAQSENVAKKTDSETKANFVVETPTGLEVGHADRCLRGQYGLIVVRDHTIDGDDFDDVWENNGATNVRNYFNAALEPLGQTGVGNERVQWMMCHGFITLDTVVEDGWSAGFLGEDVTDTNLLVYNRGTFDPPNFMWAQDFFLFVQPNSVTTGAAAFKFISPYIGDEQPYGEFFTKNTYTVGGVGLMGEDGHAGTAPLLHDLGVNTPTGGGGAVRVMTIDRSWTQRKRDADEQTYPENIAHGFIDQRLSNTVGVFNRPCRVKADERWFGFDNTKTPYVAGADPVIDLGLMDFSTLWTSGDGGFRGPGDGVFIPEGGSVYGAKAKEEVGSKFVGDERARFRYYFLKGPGMCKAVSFQAVKAEKQDQEGAPIVGFGMSGTFDLEGQMPFTQEADIVDTLNRQITFLGVDLEEDIEIGWACFISDDPFPGTGENGWGVVELVQVSAVPDTVVTIGSGDNFWFTDPPGIGATCEFGPWSIHTFELTIEELSETPDDETGWFRGVNFTTDATGPAVLFACDAWQPNEPGWLFGTSGMGDHGYLYAMNRTQETAAGNYPWIEALDIDIALIALAQTQPDHDPGEEAVPTNLDDIAKEFFDVDPTMEICWIGVPSRFDSPIDHDPWHLHMHQNCCGEGKNPHVSVWVSIVEHADYGIIEDQVADGLHADGAHLSLRGLSLAAKLWLELLDEHADP